MTGAGRLTGEGPSALARTHGALLRRGAAVQLAHFARKLLDACGQLVHFVVTRHAEAMERARDAILEHLLELVPGFLAALANLAERRLDVAARLGHLRICELACLRIERGAFLDQRLEQLAAFGLRLDERAEAGEPDLLRRIHHGLADA